jgi:hypothetical protein
VQLVGAALHDAGDAQRAGQVDRLRVNLAERRLQRVRDDETPADMSSMACSNVGCAAINATRSASFLPPLVTGGRTGVCAARKGLILSNALLSFIPRSKASSVVRGTMA